MKSRALLCVAAIALAGLGGCAVVPGPYGPQVVPAPVVVAPAPVYRAPVYGYGYVPPPAVYGGWGRGWYGRGYHRW